MQLSPFYVNDFIGMIKKPKSFPKDFAEISSRYQSLWVNFDKVASLEKSFFSLLYVWLVEQLSLSLCLLYM